MKARPQTPSFGTPPKLGQRLLSDRPYGIAGLLPREGGRSLVEKVETRRDKQKFWKPQFSSLLVALLLFQAFVWSWVLALRD